MGASMESTLVSCSAAGRSGDTLSRGTRASRGASVTHKNGKGIQYETNGEDLHRLSGNAVALPQFSCGRAERHNEVRSA